MEPSEHEEDNKDEYVDSRTVKTIRSLRKSSAKKTPQTTKIVKRQDNAENEGQKEFRIKKKSSVNKSRVMI
jgi:hypothetical protein